MNKKAIISITLGIITLAVLIIGAAYAYFLTGTSYKEYLTTAGAHAEELNSISLESGATLNLSLRLVDMMKQDDDVEYYATEDGTPSTEENIIPLAIASSVGNEPYMCQYALNVEYSGNMKESIPGEGSVILNVNGIEYDLYNESFPLTINGEISEITNENPKIIYGSLKIVNLKETDQSGMAEKNMALTVTATEFNCFKEYSITYNLDGGAFTEEQPTKYNEDTETFTLGIPFKDGYIFSGWTGTDLSDVTDSVTINKGSKGNRTYTANWKMITPFDSYYCANVSAGSEPYVITYTGNCEVVDDGNNDWKVKFLTTGTFTLNSDLSIDIFVVGGGGGGAKGSAYKAQASRGGGGGGGGAAITVKSFPATTNTTYGIDIGAAGSSSSFKVGDTAYYTALGGSTASDPYYDTSWHTPLGAGGAGRLSGETSDYGAASVTVKAGASGGADGNYEFDETGNTRYGAGGGTGGHGVSTGSGGYGGSGSAGGADGGGKGGSGCDYIYDSSQRKYVLQYADVGGTGGTNTGSGGGGGGGACGNGSTNSGKNSAGGAGGSGIVIIRNAR